MAEQQPHSTTEPVPGGHSSDLGDEALDRGGRAAGFTSCLSSGFCKEPPTR